MNSKISRYFSVISFFLIFSCAEEKVEDPKEVPKEWLGMETDFQKDFNLQTEGNETLLIHRESSLPFAGKIERNGTKKNTTQTFENGKLNGISIKKSKDGSWVEAHYKDGKLDGNMTFFGKDGRKRSRLVYKSGVLQR